MKNQILLKHKNKNGVFVLRKVCYSASIIYFVNWFKNDGQLESNRFLCFGKAVSFFYSLLDSKRIKTKPAADYNTIFSTFINSLWGQYAAH